MTPPETQRHLHAKAHTAKLSLQDSHCFLYRRATTTDSCNTRIKDMVGHLLKFSGDTPSVRWPSSCIPMARPQTDNVNIQCAVLLQLKDPRHTNKVPIKPLRCTASPCHPHKQRSTSWTSLASNETQKKAVPILSLSVHATNPTKPDSLWYMSFEAISRHLILSTVQNSFV